MRVGWWLVVGGRGAFTATLFVPAFFAIRCARATQSVHRVSQKCWSHAQHKLDGQRPGHGAPERTRGRPRKIIIFFCRSVGPVPVGQVVGGGPGGGAFTSSLFPFAFFAVRCARVNHHHQLCFPKKCMHTTNRSRTFRSFAHWPPTHLGAMSESPDGGRSRRFAKLRAARGLPVARCEASRRFAGQSPGGNPSRQMRDQSP